MKSLAIRAIRLYQRAVSPVLPPSCKYQPTCSEYGIQAITRHGVIRGSFLTVWRILRCNPWSKGGYDPIPGDRRLTVAGE